MGESRGQHVLMGGRAWNRGIDLMGGRAMMQLTICMQLQHVEGERVREKRSVTLNFGSVNYVMNSTCIQYMGSRPARIYTCTGISPVPLGARRNLGDDPQPRD